MSSMLNRIVLGLCLMATGVLAQGAPSQAPDAASKAEPKAEPKTDKPKDAGPSATTAIAAAKKKAEERRVLKPSQIPGELVRLKSKADIKAELKIRTTPGRPAVVFKGVIRNGKLIERIVNSRFVAQNSVSHPRAGVRIWWAGNSDGYIFFRYSSIETISITGKLTAKERAEIMRRLQAKREGRDPDEVIKAAAELEAKKFADIEKMSPRVRGEFLMARYPEGLGWTGKRFRELRRKKTLDDVKLPPEEELFVKYYRALEKVRYQALRTAAKKKEEFKPRSGDSGDEGEQPSSADNK